MEIKDIVKAANLREAIGFWFQGEPSNRILGPQGKITIKKCFNCGCSHGAIITDLLAGLPLFTVHGDSTGEWKFDDPTDGVILNGWNEKW